jgi:hypothetical protein
MTAGQQQYAKRGKNRKKMMNDLCMYYNLLLRYDGTSS